MRQGSYFVRMAAALLAAAWCCGGAHAQDYPQKPIRVVAAFPVGSLPDILARSIGGKMTERVKQQVVVENRLGAGGNIAYETVAKSAPDGHTLLVGSNSFVVNPSLYRSVPYDPFRDFAPITRIAVQSFMVVVQASSPATSVQELVALAKASPGKLSYGSSGNGTLHHLAGEMFKGATGVSLVHVPYKGAIFAMNDLLAGRLDLMFLDVVTMLSQVKAGKLRVLASVGSTRDEIFPEVPTLGETGVPGIGVNSWYGFLAPAGTPPAVVSRLNTELIAVISDAELRQWLFARGATMTGGEKPEEFAAFLRGDSARWAKIVQSTGVKVD